MLEKLLPWYIVGLVDGEGSLCIIRRTNKYTETYSANLTIVNTSKELLLTVKDWFGLGKVYLTDKKQSNDGHVRKHCYTLQIHGATLTDALPMFMESLELKKEQAYALLEAARLAPSTGNHYSNKVRARLCELSGYVRWLNRGCP